MVKIRPVLLPVFSQKNPVLFANFGNDKVSTPIIIASPKHSGIFHCRYTKVNNSIKPRLLMR